MCTAASAPIASAVRSVSTAALPPIVTAVMSATSFFSLRRTASSIAISQKGFIACFTPASSTPRPDAAMRVLTA